MKTIIKNFILIAFFQASIFAHSLLLNVYNNENNTIQVEGMFDTGEAATGAQVRLESLSTQKVLYVKRLPLEGELTIKIPQEPYQIILDGGPSHSIIKEGIPPISGFIKTSTSTKKNLNSQKESIKNKINTKNNIILLSILITILLFLITIFISIRNTNKLLKILKAKK